MKAPPPFTLVTTARAATLSVCNTVSLSNTVCVEHYASVTLYVCNTDDQTNTPLTCKEAPPTSAAKEERDDDHKDFYLFQCPRGTTSNDVCSYCFLFFKLIKAKPETTTTTTTARTPPPPPPPEYTQHSALSATPLLAHICGSLLKSLFM